MTELEALKMTFDMWNWLAETGLGKGDYPKWIELGIYYMPSWCPLCEYYGFSCSGCPLGNCNDGSLYDIWEGTTKEDKKHYAKKIADIVAEKIKGLS